MDTQKILTDTAAEVKSLADRVEDFKATAEEVAEVKKAMSDTIEKMDAQNETQKAAIEANVKDVADYRKALESDFGKSGSRDYREEINKFFQAVFHTQRQKAMPAHLTKAAADYVTSTDAQGGYFVPTLLQPKIREITEMHGKLFPLVPKVILKPGQTTNMPWDSTLPTMTWRSAQGTAATEDAGPVAFGADALTPILLHDYVKIANELLMSSEINIVDAFVTRMISKGVRAIETALIAGDDSGTHPHDGLLVASSVNAQSALATPTFALMANFIGECIADHEGSEDVSENLLITTAAVTNVLASQPVAAAIPGMMTWGDPRTGTPAQFQGYNLITHPSCISTTNRVIMTPVNKMIVGWTGNWAVDFNAFSGWTSNETWMMVKTHADYGLGNPDWHHKAVVTALA